MGKTPVDEKIFLFTEFQLRYGLDYGLTKQSVFRAGPIYQFNDTHEVGLLYGFIATGAVKEHRYTQQIQSRWTDLFTTRLRLEERELEGRNQWNLRTRLLLRWQQVLFGQTSLVVWDELFLLLNNPAWTYKQFYDRNRLFVGLRTPLLAKLNGEFGYLHQQVNGNVDLNEHIIAFYFYF